MLITGGLILRIGRRRNRTNRDLVLPERDVKPGRARPQLVRLGRKFRTDAQD
jgi:hypothetical protein